MPKHLPPRLLYVHKGFITLTGILIIAVVSVTIVVAFFGLAVGSMKTATSFKHGEQARALAESCIEEALGQLRISNAYLAGQTIAFTHGTCQVVSISGSGNTNRVISAIGIVENSTRRIQVTVTELLPAIQISSWLDVSIF